MSTGRGRGYSGRHHLRDPRPGDSEQIEELHAARTLAELSPRASDPSKLDMSKPDPIDKKSMEPAMDPEKADDDQHDGTPEQMYNISVDDEISIKELLSIDEQYTPLLTLLEQFSPGEDGIQFNRKLRQFETTISSMCPDEARLLQAFATFRAAALMSSVTARKLAAVGASFTRQQRQQLLRTTLLNVVMQGTYAKLDVLERTNPTFLINAVNLMGDYFAEARLCNGNKVQILASPLLHYMRALLASDDIRAHRSLATQLMQNGRELLSLSAQELDDLSIAIRLRLLTPPPVSIIWLVLSADLCLNKFLPLPSTLQQFYASHLKLTIDENYSEVNYGSWKKTEQDEFSNSDVPDKVSQTLSQISLNHDDDTKPKLRPILGAGAGLLRQNQSLSVSQDSFETWSKTSLTKRYDLNSWRQEEELTKEEPEPVFNPTVLPPNVPSFPVTIPDYPPPTVRYNNYSQEKFPNYLQQGDGAYIQNQYPNNSFSSQGDFATQYPTERAQTANFTPATETPEFVPQFDKPERVNNEIQKTSNRRPIENWRKEKMDLKDELNRNKPKNWTRQLSKDNVTDDEDKDKSEGDQFKSRSSRDVRPGMNRRNSSETESGTSGKTPPRRHVSDVPRNHKYWDHDDRCDKDYNS